MAGEAERVAERYGPRVDEVKRELGDHLRRILSLG
jgi:hypothetical protein